MALKWATIGFCSGLALALAGYARFVEPGRYRLIQRDVRIPGLPAGLDGLTFLHVSDLHVRRYNSGLATFMDELSRLEIDIVAITGDLIGAESGIEACADMFRVLRGRHGVYVVMGNHDHFRYPRWTALMGVFSHRKSVATERIVAAVKSHGFRVLTNESERLEVNGEVVHLVGIDDMFSQADDLPRAMENIDITGTRILLSHSPDIFEDAVSLGFHLVLSGHTHGGQVRLPLFGALTTHTMKPLRPASGMIYGSKTAMHVSQGLGTSGLPIRFLCPPEATVLRLQRV